MLSPSRFAVRVALATLLALTLSPGIMAAQIGGALNKAKKQVLPGATASDSLCTKPEFDDVILELLPARIAAVMNGVQITRSLAGPDGVNAQAMLARVDSIHEEQERLLKGKQPQIDRYDEAVRKHETCRTAALDSIRDAHHGQMQGRMMTLLNSDPAAMERIQKLSMDLNEAQSSGDTAGARKALTEYNKILGIDPVADTAAAHALCGKPPVRPAWLARSDSLGLVANKLTEDARALEGRAAAEGAKAAGMNERQFAMARERIFIYVSSDGKTGAEACFNQKEREALAAKLKELKGMDFQ